ncbi:MAG: S1 RNA-binding domain-containing protein [Bdellovibrionales bacterium]
MAKKRTHDHLFQEDQVVAPENEFDALLTGTAVQSRRFAPGDRLSGEILAVSGQEAFVSTGTAIDAIMPFAIGPDVQPPKVGDRVEVIVVRTRDNEIFVKAVGSRGVGIEADNLEDAYKMEIPVDGTVLEAVKGGFRVKVQAIKAFCPISQMDFRVVSAEDYVGKKFSFLITKYERGRDLVVSRRKILEGDRAASEAQFLQNAKVDDVFSGTVFRLEKYGAFVRLQNGVEGLIPISEISWGRINHLQDVLNLDQNVQVKLLKASQEEGRLKLSFSVKQGGSVVDPWLALPSQFPVGTQVEGVVEGKESFGLFVNIASGVTGLLPRSAWRESTEGSQYENKRRGDKIKVQIQNIDLDARKLSFTLPGEEVDDSWRGHASAAATKSGGMGTFADLLKGVKPK